MNMKKISAAIALALSAGVMGSAGAVTLVAGNLKFTLDNYDQGTTGYSANCTSVAACDAQPGITPAPGAVGSEDTWGIFSIASITKISDGSTIYTRGPGDFLTGIFYGLTDHNVLVDPISGLTSTYSIGGALRLFNNTTNYNPTLGAGGRIGVNGYNSVTNVGGTEVLDAVFSNGVTASAVGAVSSYKSVFDTLGIAGSGSGYLDVTGGTWAAMLGTHQEIDPNGNHHDLFLSTTFSPQPFAPNWTVVSSSQVTGAVPEPASLALLGLGLAGLAGLRRRRS